MTEWEREVVEFLEEMANWNVPYQQRKVKGMMARREAAQRLLAALYSTPGPVDRDIDIDDGC